MIEAGVAIAVMVMDAPVEIGQSSAPVFYWHSPDGRTGGSLPDSRKLWDVLWALRKAEYLGFAHSHPGSGIPGPSMTDLTTFAAIEVGLGRRLVWWITSSDRTIELRWKGPGKLEYESRQIDDPNWVHELRRLSKMGVDER